MLKYYFVCHHSSLYLYIGAVQPQRFISSSLNESQLALKGTGRLSDSVSSLLSAIEDSNAYIKIRHTKLFMHTAMKKLLLPRYMDFKPQECTSEEKSVSSSPKSEAPSTVLSTPSALGEHLHSILGPIDSKSTPSVCSLGAGMCALGAGSCSLDDDAAGVDDFRIDGVGTTYLPTSHVDPIPAPKKLSKLVGQAIMDWSMIEEGDRILLGLSGGKDSLAMLHILLAVQVRSHICDLIFVVF